MRIGKFCDAFAHERFFEVVEIDDGVDFANCFRIGKSIDLAIEGESAICNGVVSAWRVGLNVAASECLNIFPSWIIRFFCAGTGEDDFLLKRTAFVLPKFLIAGPDALRIDDSDESLRSVGKFAMFLGINVDAGNENTVDTFER